MKKSIGIIAAVVLSASVYSQNYDPANPHSSGNSAQTESSTSSSDTISSSPGRAEFDAQSSLRDKAQGDYNDGAAKQGLTLTDEEAAQTLRNTDDPDLANRNQEEGLADPDRALESVDNAKPDVIYEEWILITPEDVGSPAETESGTDRSIEHGRDVPNRPEMDQDDEFSSAFDRETGVLNDERIHSGEDYSRDYVGAPGSVESGTSRSVHEDDCEVNKSKSVQSSGSAVDHDERLNLERESVGSPAGTESGSSRSSELDSTVRSSGAAVDSDERDRSNRSRSDEESNKSPEDSKVESSRSQELNPLETNESRPIPPDL